MPTPTATERLAHFVRDLDPAKLPAAVREQATLCVLDALGIALAGMSEPSARAARAVATGAGGRAESRVLVSGERLPAQAAAMVNGTAAFSHNFTDTTLTCILHAGPAVVPAALAAGELAGATGAEVLAAVVAGYEVMSRVGSAINGGPARMAHQKKGFHHPQARAWLCGKRRRPGGGDVSPDLGGHQRRGGEDDVGRPPHLLAGHQRSPLLRGRGPPRWPGARSSSTSGTCGTPPCSTSPVA